MLYPASEKIGKFDAATALANYGFYVFPLVPNDTRPLFEDGEQLATKKLDRVERWWSEVGDANIGISTDHLLVIDVDRSNEGFETFRNLAATENGLPGTLVVAGLSGTQVLYWLPHTIVVGGGTGKLGPGVSVRSVGEYIVASGSTIDGRAYTWKPGYEPDKHEFARAPQWLIDRCSSQ